MDGYDSFIYDDEESTAKGNTNKEEYQGLPDSPDIYNIREKSGTEIPANNYNQYIVAEVVLPDSDDEKQRGKIRKRIKYDLTITGEVQYIVMNNSSVYEVGYPDGKMEEITANIITENIVS